MPQSNERKVGFLRRVSPVQWYALALLCLVGVFEFLNFTDFCYSEWRYLGDEGLIDATIRYELEQASRKGFHKYAFRRPIPRGQSEVLQHDEMG